MNHLAWIYLPVRTLVNYWPKKEQTLIYRIYNLRLLCCVYLVFYSVLYDVGGYRKVYAPTLMNVRLGAGLL